MNVFETISDLVEKQTGYRCVYAKDNIEDNQILLHISQIEQLESTGMFRVCGSFTLKTGTIMGWNILNTLLQLELTGSKSVASLMPTKDEFIYMSIDFLVVVTEIVGRSRVIKSLEWEKE